MTIKNRVIKGVVGLALLLALTAGGGIAADALGLEVTSQASACAGGVNGGGGC